MFLSLSLWRFPIEQKQNKILLLAQILTLLLMVARLRFSGAAAHLANLSKLDFRTVVICFFSYSERAHLNKQKKGTCLAGEDQLNMLTS